MFFARVVTGLFAACLLPSHRNFPATTDRATTSRLPTPKKRTPEENKKDTRKKVERLYPLAAEVKKEVDKTDSRNVLSMNPLKKAEEIEKLAHGIRKRSKG